MPEPQTVVIQAITSVLEGREDDERLEVTLDARLSEDLRLDSLELAALSEELSDALGRDPYTEGLEPVTVGEVVAFYEA